MQDFIVAHVIVWYFHFNVPKDEHPTRFIQLYIWLPGTLACQEI